MDISKLFEANKLLKTYELHILKRVSLFHSMLNLINENYKSLSEFSKAHVTFGVHVSGSDIIVTEWIPNVKKAYLIGDFNNWDYKNHELLNTGDSIFQLVIKNINITQLNGSRVKLMIITNSDKIIYRVSPWSRFMLFNDKRNILEPIFYWKENPYVFKHQRPVTPETIKIYEAHIGISSSEQGVASYSHFQNQILPRIKQLGYNTIQLMGLMEHAYYASFGYQVTNFFAPSSRFGKPDELKELIDTAHGLGLRVLMDLVHSHASSNIDDGLNEFNGSTEGFFHAGPRGYHPVWKTRLFNYSKLPVIRFLISNLRWWVEEFQIDGFRFDGVSSMLYFDHGLRVRFTGEYYKYFDPNVDMDSVMYLMLANYFLKSHFPYITTICEEVSGMPLLCRSLDEGGFGFDYRLGMGIPDMWNKVIQSKSTSDWNMDYIVSELCNRIEGEKTIAYVESHDQALVGDKTLAHWLMDRYMYTSMSIFTPCPIISRGLSLLMIIRMLTHSLGGEGYLNFIGNEFGHPEWLDFPRKENKFSYLYARRQWNLVDDVDLKYKFLNRFDHQLNTTEEEYKWLSSKKATMLHVCNTNKIVAFMRAKCVFLLNFHEHKSYESFKIGINVPGKYRCVLNTDNALFGGFNRLEQSVSHFSQPGIWQNQEQYILVYLPSQSGQICVLED